MKPERWGSPLVQEKYHEEKVCDKRNNNNNNNNNNNVTKKEADKILKYEDLKIEIQHTWNSKTKVTSKSKDS